MKTRYRFLVIMGLLLLACSNNDEGIPLEPMSSEKQLISFRFIRISDNGVAVDISAEIDQQDKAVGAEMPPNTDITNLQPEVEISERAVYEPIGPQDFSTPINYTITAEDGTSRTYLVTVEVALSQKDILLKIVEANPGNNLDWKKTDNLSDWEEVTIDGDGQVIKLDIFARGLTILPPEIGNLISLESLRLRENKISTLPPEITQLSSLRSLNLINNLFETLPPEIGQLNELERLMLDGNDLQSLSPEIGQLIGLQYLGLAGNNLKNLPREIGQLISLEHLDLDGNELSDLPPEMGQLTNLGVLKLEGNQLHDLPPEIGQLTNLDRLYLYGNSLTLLPMEMSQLSNLRILDLRYNELEGLGIDHIPMFNSNPLVTSCESNLQGLYLGGNKVPMVLDDCICELDIDNGGTIDIDIVKVPDPDNPNPLVICQGDVIGN